MAYSDIQQTEFNRATENLIEITWTYVNLQKEFPKLSETDSMGWKQMFVVWANEFEENYGRTDWDESEKTYQEAIEEFAKEKIFQWVGIRKYICIGRHIEGITLNTLTAALGTLSMRECEIIYARFYKGQTLEEIGDTLHCSKGNIDCHIQNAFRKLRRGKYGKELASFLPDQQERRAIRNINRESERKTAGLSEQEKELLL